MARQFCAALIATLLLIFPLRAILGTTTYEAMYGWLFGSVAAVIALSFLLRWVGIPRARSSVVAALGSFAVFVVIGLWAVASMGDPGDDGTLALTVGIPSATLATLVAMVVTHRGGEFAPGIAVAIGAVGLLTVMVMQESITSMLHDARDAAEQQEEFESAGLEPYVPQIDGMDAYYAGTTYRNMDTGGAVGYALTYRPEGAEDDDRFGSDVKLKVSVNEEPCESVGDVVACHERGGYVVEERDGDVNRVLVQGSTSLSVTYPSNITGGLPDPDVVGSGLSDAEPVEWDDLFGLPTR